MSLDNISSNLPLLLCVKAAAAAAAAALALAIFFDIEKSCTSLISIGPPFIELLLLFCKLRTNKKKEKNQ